MRFLIKIWLWIAGLIVAAVAGLFLIGFILDVTGWEAPTKEPASEAAVKIDTGLDNAPLDINKPSVDSRPIDRANTELEAPANTLPALSLPETLTAIDAPTWMTKEGLLYLKDGRVGVERSQFARLSGEDILALYKIFDKAYQAEDRKPSTPETESRKNSYRGLRIMTFAGGAALPPDARRDFADKSGAVFPPSALSHRIRRGDYLALFAWKNGVNTDIADAAIRGYAEVLSDKEMIYVLNKIGAITVPDSSNHRTRRNWRIHPGEALSGLRPETQQAIHDAIDDTFMGDRPKLRQKIRNIINANHTANSGRGSSDEK